MNGSRSDITQIVLVFNRFNILLLRNFKGRDQIKSDGPGCKFDEFPEGA
jgi:hypothetical protein